MQDEETVLDAEPTAQPPSSTLRVITTFPELLSVTAAPEDGGTRVKLFGLPRDNQLNDRLAFVICGPAAGRVAGFLVAALESIQPPATHKADENGLIASV